MNRLRSILVAVVPLAALVLALLGIAGCGATPSPPSAGSARPAARVEPAPGSARLGTVATSTGAVGPMAGKAGLRRGREAGYRDTLPDDYFRPPSLADTKAGMKRLAQHLAIELDLEAEMAVRPAQPGADVASRSSGAPGGRP